MTSTTSATTRSRVTDPGTPDPHDVIVPVQVRLADRVVGIVLPVVAVLIFILGRQVAAATKANPIGLDLRPWALTPLTARVMSGRFALPGAVGLVLSQEPRSSGWRIMIESQVISLVFILLGAARAWNNFKQHSPLTWLFVIGMSILVISLGALYVSMERRRDGSASPALPPDEISDRWSIPFTMLSLSAAALPGCPLPRNCVAAAR